jgi:hypothetical protein
MGTFVQRLLASCIGVVAVITGPALSQGTEAAQPAKKEAKGPTPIDKAGERERLDKFKQDIAQKVVPPRLVKKGRRRVDKWLKSFQVVQSKHYLVFTNGPTTTVKRFAKSLEELYAFTKKLWPFDDIDHHLRAYVFASEEEYFDFCVNVVGWPRASAQGTAGHATSAYYATYYQSPKSDVVMHEATHQIVGACLKINGVGSWFQEGMAVYVENEILGGKVASGMRADLRNDDYYPFPKFVEIQSLIADPHSSRNYRHAGCIIEFMMQTKDERMAGRFPEFLKAARRGYDRGADTAQRLFKTVYGMTLEEVDVAFLAFHRVKPTGR